jgi:hypothetical protein
MEEKWGWRRPERLTTSEAQKKITTRRRLWTFHLDV